MQRLCTKSLISLCNLCVLCVSVVVFPKQSSTTEAQRTQRCTYDDFSCKASAEARRSRVSTQTLRLLSETPANEIYDVQKSGQLSKNA